MNRHFGKQNEGQAKRIKLPAHSVYRSIAGREAYLDFYDRILARQPGAAQTRTIPTRFGSTRLTIGGNASGAPLIVLPGMSISGPAMLEFFARLGRKRQLIAPDLIGQPGLSKDMPFPPGEGRFGQWLADILDALRLERADMATASFGSSIALDLASLAPQRVGRLALLMPAGLTPKLPLMTIYARLALSWMAYRHLPIRALLPRIARPLSRSLTDDNLDYLDIIIRHTAFWRHRPAGPFGPDDLERFTAPTFLVLAEGDILFPYETTRANARASLRLAHEVVLKGSAHMPSAAEIAPVLDTIAEFFD